MIRKGKYEADRQNECIDPEVCEKGREMTRCSPLAGGVDWSSALPASKIVTVREAARHFSLDEVTIRKKMRDGCPGCRIGRRGPGNGGLVDLQHMAIWLGRANAPQEQTREDTMLKIAEDLWKTLNEDHADLRSGASRADAAAVLLVAWERLCKSIGRSYAFDHQPKPIRILMSEL